MKNLNCFSKMYTFLSKERKLDGDTVFRVAQAVSRFCHVTFTDILDISKDETCFEKKRKRMDRNR